MYKSLKKLKTNISKAPSNMIHQRHLQSARGNREGTTCGSVHLQLHKPHVAISRPHDLIPQSSVAVTHLLTGCYSFYLSFRYEILNRDYLLQGLNRDLLNARVNMRRSDFYDSTNWASQNNPNRKSPVVWTLRRTVHRTVPSCEHHISPLS